MKNCDDCRYLDSPNGEYPCVDCDDNRSLFNEKNIGGDDMQKILKAISDFQNECKVVMFDKTNAFFKGSKYASLQTIIIKITPLLQKNGLSIHQIVEGKTLVTKLYHIESGQCVSSSCPLLLADKETMQALGSAITYARRYSICAMLNIAGDDDDDGNVATFHKSEPDEEKKYPAKPQTKKERNEQVIQATNQHLVNKETGEIVADVKGTTIVGDDVFASEQEIALAENGVFVSDEEVALINADSKDTIANQKTAIKKICFERGISLKVVPEMIMAQYGKVKFEQLNATERTTFIKTLTNLGVQK